MENEIIGVILAAGEGSRMRPFSDKFPKALLPICNKPLIDYHIESMKSIGIREIIILIGNKGSAIIDVIGAGDKYGIKIRYIEQRERLGIAHAVGKLEHEIQKPFLLFLGDIFFVSKNLNEMYELFKTQNLNAVLATKVEHDPEAIKKNFSVIEDKQGYVKRVIEKPRHAETNIKGCGIYLFDMHIFDAIRRTPRTAIRDEYEITDSIQILIDDGFKIKTCKVIEGDINLTYPKDVLNANLIQLKNEGKKNVIGENTKIRDVMLINNSVIGDNASIKEKIRVLNSIVFPGTIVSVNKDLEMSIAYDELVIEIGKE